MPKTAKYPEFVAVVANALARYADDAPDKTPLDSAVKAALDTRHRSREFAIHAVRSFNREIQRAASSQFGVTRITSKPLPTAISSSAAKSIGKVAIAAGGVKTGQAAEMTISKGMLEKLEQQIPHYTINYTGMYCKEETTVDGFFTNSDEIYVTTTAIPYPLDPNKVVTVRHPVTQPYYGDVDTGEVRPGPLAQVWTGNRGDLSLATVVMEQDSDDPTAIRDKIDVVFTVGVAALAEAGFKLPDDLGEKLADVLADLVSWLLGLSDDLISDEYVTLYAATMDGYVQTPPAPFVKDSTPTGILEHFNTVHHDGGATYEVFYTVTKQ